MVEGRYIETLLEKSPLMVYVVELKPPELRKIIYYNPAFEKYLGWRREDVKSPRWWIENVHPEDRERVLNNLKKLMENGEISHYYRFRKKDGSYIWIYSHALLVERRDTLLVVSGYWVDITFVQEKKELYKAILENSPILVFLTGERIVYTNETAKEITGYTREELTQMCLWEIFHEDYRNEIRGIVESLVKCGNVPKRKITLEAPIIRKDGGKVVLRITFYTLIKDGKCYALVLGTDVSPQKELEDKLIKAVLHDTLTGLPNRIFFLEHLKNLIRLALRKGELVAVLAIDLDEFSKINATYGTKVGDEILKRVAERIKNSLGGRGLVARFYADEFGVAFIVRNLNELSHFLEKLREEFSKSLNVKGKLIFVNARIGVSIAPKDGTKPEDVMNKAEVALKTAQAEKKRIAFFSKEIEVEISEYVHLRDRLITAIERDEFALYYQPIVDLKKNKVVGVEALLRWITPDGYVITPDRFIPAAEELELIVPIGNLVVDKAFRHLSELLRRGYDLFLSVNFSIKQFMEEELPKKIAEKMTEYDIPKGRFLLEITESVAMESPENTKLILRRLKEEGVMIGIDDFGTGYSSMAYLIQFEIDRLKIDKSFTDNIHKDKKVREVAGTIIRLAHSLGAKAIAEGIEKEEQRKVLEELGCDEGQGYLFAKPMSFENLLKWLSSYGEPD